jgi:phage shock protein C
MILGVCRGLADYLEVSPFWLRLFAFLAFVFSGFWPVVGIYFVMALLMRPEPVLSFTSEGDEAFYHSYVQSRGTALRRLKKTFDDLQRRIQRIETIVTSREYDWEQRLRNG